MNAKKKLINISPNEEVSFLKKLAEEKRKNRIKQVREQEKNVSLAVREKVKKSKDLELRKIALLLQTEFDEKKEEEERFLLLELERRLKQIGQGHKLHDKENYGEMKRISSELKRNIVKRYNHAMTKVLHEKQVQNMKKEKLQHLRDQVYDMEQQRKQNIVSLPKQEPDPILNLLPVKVMSSFNKQGMLESFSYTCHHLPSFDSEVDPHTVVEKACEENQVDARLAADEEERRVQAIKEKHEREIEERKEKAELRHTYARREVILNQQKASLMEELEDLELKDRQRRRDVVADIPKKVFQPPYQRIEDGKIKQFNLEQAFENVYNAKSGDVLGSYYNDIKDLGDSVLQESDISASNQPGVPSQGNGEADHVPKVEKNLVAESVQQNELKDCTLQREARASKLEKLRERIKQQKYGQRILQKETLPGMQQSSRLDSLQSMNIESAYQSSRTAKSSSIDSSDAVNDGSGVKMPLHTSYAQTGEQILHDEPSDLTRSNLAYNQRLLKHQADVMEMQRKRLRNLHVDDRRSSQADKMIDSSQQIDIFMPHVSNVSSGTPSSYRGASFGEEPSPQSTNTVSNSAETCIPSQHNCTSSLEQYQLVSEEDVSRIDKKPATKLSIDKENVDSSSPCGTESLCDESIKRSDLVEEGETQTKEVSDCNAETQTSFSEHCINDTEKIEKCTKSEGDVSNKKLSKVQYDEDKIERKKKQLKEQYPNLFTFASGKSPVTLDRIQQHRKQLQKQRELLQKRKQGSLSSTSNAYSGVHFSIDRSETKCAEIAKGNMNDESVITIDEPNIPKQERHFVDYFDILWKSKANMPKSVEFELHTPTTLSDLDSTGTNVMDISQSIPQFNREETVSPDVPFYNHIPRRQQQTNIPNISDLDLTDTSFANEQEIYLLPSVRAVLKELKHLRTSINSSKEGEEADQTGSSAQNENNDNDIDPYLDYEYPAAVDFTSSVSLPSFQCSEGMYPLTHYDASPVSTLDSSDNVSYEIPDSMANRRHYQSVPPLYTENISRPIRVSANPQVSPIREVEEMTPQRLAGISTLDEQSLSGSSLPVQTRSSSLTYNEDGLSIVHLPADAGKETATFQNLTKHTSFESDHRFDSEQPMKQFFPLRALKSSVSGVASFSNDVKEYTEVISEEPQDYKIQSRSPFEQNSSSDNSPLFLPTSERHNEDLPHNSPRQPHIKISPLSFLNIQNNYRQAFHTLEHDQATTDYERVDDNLPLYGADGSVEVTNRGNTPQKITVYSPSVELSSGNSEFRQSMQMLPASQPLLANEKEYVFSNAPFSQQQQQQQQTYEQHQEQNEKEISSQYLFTQPFGISHSSSTSDSLSNTGKYRELLQRVKQLPFVHLEEQQSLIESFSRQPSLLSSPSDLSYHSIASEYGDIRVEHPIIISNSSSSSVVSGKDNIKLEHLNALSSSDNTALPLNGKHLVEQSYTSTGVSVLTEQIIDTVSNSYHHSFPEVDDTSSHHLTSQSDTSFKELQSTHRTLLHENSDNIPQHFNSFEPNSSNAGEAYDNLVRNRDDVEKVSPTAMEEDESDAKIQQSVMLARGDLPEAAATNGSDSETKSKFLMSYFKDITMPEFLLRKYSESGSERMSLMSLTQESFLGLPAAGARPSHSVKDLVILEEPKEDADISQTNHDQNLSYKSEQASLSKQEVDSNEGKNVTSGTVSITESSQEKQISSKIPSSQSAQNTQSLLSSDRTLTELMQLAASSSLSPSFSSSSLEKSTIDLINELISSKSPMSDAASSELFTVGKLKLRDGDDRDVDTVLVDKIHTEISLLSDLDLSSMSEHSFNWSSLLPYSKFSEKSLSSEESKNDLSSSNHSLSLQEAFLKRKQKFIENSTSRMDGMKTKANSEKTNDSENKERISKPPGVVKKKVGVKNGESVHDIEKQQPTSSVKLDKEKLKEKRMDDRHRTKRLYERNPEVQKQMAEREKIETMRKNKEKVQLFHEKLQNKRKKQLQRKKKK